MIFDIHFKATCLYVNVKGIKKRCIGPVVVCSTADRKAPGSNPILAKHEFLWAQEMNLQGSTEPRCELVP